MNINLDIQNILVLKTMYELRNVRLVAQALGKTSGAISKNITKLKTQLNDPLFIQSKQGFEPTAFVETNMAHFETILETVEAIKHREFTPESLQDMVRIYANTLFWDRYGDLLYFALRKDAPHAKFSFLRWGVNPRNKMIEGEKAIAIHSFDDNFPQSISQREIGADKAVFFVREDHPAEDFESLMKFPMVILKTPGWNDHKYLMLERLEHIGWNITPAIEVEHPVISHKIVLQSDHFGLTMKDNVPDGCRVIDLPNIQGLDVTYVISCRRAQQNDPLNQWLFKVISNVMRTV
jgi:DNA-binding transcriptional LysR family regulator